MQFTILSPVLYSLLFTEACAQVTVVAFGTTYTRAAPATTMATTTKPPGVVVVAFGTTYTRPAPTSKTTSSVMTTASAASQVVVVAFGTTYTRAAPTGVKTTAAAATTTSATSAVVTNQAYIDTILRHHNVHRANHSANALTWSPNLAAIAQEIGSSCVYAHDLVTGGGGYGQNIGYGFRPVNMGQFVTTGLYNSEVNSYTYFGGEPDINTLSQWGHFSQIVWQDTTEVGCYTYDCSATGLQNTVSNSLPYFTVCNYAPRGNIIGSFEENVLVSLGRASVDATYGCSGSALNCVN